MKSSSSSPSVPYSSSSSPSSSGSNRDESTSYRGIGYLGALSQRLTRFFRADAKFFRAAAGAESRFGSQAVAETAATAAKAAATESRFGGRVAAETATAAARASATSARAVTKMQNVLRNVRALKQNPLKTFRSLKQTPVTADLTEIVDHPVKSSWTKRLAITGYVLAWLYVVNDIAIEYWEKRSAGCKGKDLFHFLFERSLFHAIATFAVPHLLLHSTMHSAHHFCHKVMPDQRKLSPRQAFCVRWFPATCGLASLPLLPLYLDEPLEHLAERISDFVVPLSEEAHKKFHAAHHADDDHNGGGGKHHH